MLSWPNSIREINDLPEDEKRSIYQTLLPEWLFTTYGMDRQTLTISGQEVVNFRFQRVVAHLKYLFAVTFMY